jgi:hypothetical protein
MQERGLTPSVIENVIKNGYEVYSSSGHSGQPFRLSLEYTPIGSHSFNIAFIFSYNVKIEKILQHMQKK